MMIGGNKNTANRNLCKYVFDNDESSNYLGTLKTSLLLNQVKVMDYLNELMDLLAACKELIADVNLVVFNSQPHLEKIKNICNFFIEHFPFIEQFVEVLPHDTSDTVVNYLKQQKPQALYELLIQHFLTQRELIVQDFQTTLNFVQPPPSNYQYRCDDINGKGESMSMEFSLLSIDEFKRDGVCVFYENRYVKSCYNGQQEIVNFLWYVQRLNFFMLTYQQTGFTENMQVYLIDKLCALISTMPISLKLATCIGFDTAIDGNVSFKEFLLEKTRSLNQKPAVFLPRFEALFNMVRCILIAGSDQVNIEVPQYYAAFLSDLEKFIKSYKLTLSSYGKDIMLSVYLRYAQQHAPQIICMDLKAFVKKLNELKANNRHSEIASVIQIALSNNTVVQETIATNFLSLSIILHGENKTLRAYLSEKAGTHKHQNDVIDFFVCILSKSTDATEEALFREQLNLIAVSIGKSGTMARFVKQYISDQNVNDDDDDDDNNINSHDQLQLDKLMSSNEGGILNQDEYYSEPEDEQYSQQRHMNATDVVINGMITLLEGLKNETLPPDSRAAKLNYILRHSKIVAAAMKANFLPLNTMLTGKTITLGDYLSTKTGLSFSSSYKHQQHLIEFLIVILSKNLVSPTVSKDLDLKGYSDLNEESLGNKNLSSENFKSVEMMLEGKNLRTEEAFQLSLLESAGKIGSGGTMKNFVEQYSSSQTMTMEKGEHKTKLAWKSCNSFTFYQENANKKPSSTDETSRDRIEKAPYDVEDKNVEYTYTK